MMVAKPEIPPSQMMNIAKVLLHLDSSHYLDSLYWCTRVYAEKIEKPAQQLDTQLTSSCIRQYIQIAYNWFFV